MKFDQVLNELKSSQSFQRNSAGTRSSGELDLLVDLGTVLASKAGVAVKALAPKIQQMNRRVHERPWTAITVSAGCGLIGGFMLSKMRGR